MWIRKKVSRMANNKKNSFDTCCKKHPFGEYLILENFFYWIVPEPVVFGRACGTIPKRAFFVLFSGKTVILRENWRKPDKEFQTLFLRFLRYYISSLGKLCRNKKPVFKRASVKRQNYTLRNQTSPVIFINYLKIFNCYLISSYWKERRSLAN